MTATAKSVFAYDIVPVGGEFAIHRDGAILKTLREEDFVVPTLFLAEAIAEEGRAQTGKPNPASMPLTQMAFTAIDITSKQHSAIAGQVASYASNELLCHRAERPDELIQQQQELWQPILDWCAKRFHAPLRTEQGIMPIIQPSDALEALYRAVDVCDDFRLTGLRHTAETCSSLVLGLALLEQHLTAEQVFRAAECDALFQMQKWGEDPAAINRHASIRRDLEICEKWFDLLTP